MIRNAHSNSLPTSSSKSSTTSKRITPLHCLFELDLVTVLVVILLLVVELFELDVGNELLWAFLIINTVDWCTPYTVTTKI
jgi:hypothetical protein